MLETQHATERRSTRVFMRIRVRVEGKTNAGRKFRETCQTIVLNVQGALLYLEHEVANGAMLMVSNPLTQEEQECRVVFLGDAGDKGQRVGVEFLSPSPHFWGVDFQGVCRVTPSEPPHSN
ncbi:MAG TPA: PilZ domain-containing protein [Candidatus Dormibacteraeota bacterium]|nr:PilZ domain-containing protein [Candidatus Dormibacteraeota bacterium]